jgi:hypothetical protein
LDFWVVTVLADGDLSRRSLLESLFRRSLLRNPRRHSILPEGYKQILIEARSILQPLAIL